VKGQKTDDLLRQWRDDLASWAIPEEITSAVPDSPWVLPRRQFARRAAAMRAAPSGPSFDLEWAALDPPGSVLDVGAGAGAASLPLAPRATRITAVDTDDAMLESFSDQATMAGVHAELVSGTWPDVAPVVASASVVTCHHVLYNVPDVGPFLEALTDHASRLVVVEMTAWHPLTPLNPLWYRLHGLRRPDAPRAADVVEILTAMGLSPRVEHWVRHSGGMEYDNFADLVDVTRRRLCLPLGRVGELETALLELGVEPEAPRELGSGAREIATIWWRGRG
jgi:SAM-dependent methyltransferase